MSHYHMIQQGENLETFIQKLLPQQLDNYKIGSSHRMSFKGYWIKIVLSQILYGFIRTNIDQSLRSCFATRIIWFWSYGFILIRKRKDTLLQMSKCYRNVIIQSNYKNQCSHRV